MTKTLKKVIVVLTVNLLAASSAFAGGDLVNNGGGIAEKNIIYAYQKLDGYIQLCLASDLCKIDAFGRLVLTQIQGGLASERQNPNQIQFYSERSNPGMFIIDGVVKVAKTGSTIGSPILINTDLIYSKNELGYYIPVTISESVAILVHELGHHYGVYSHTDLDLLGVRVAMLLNNKTYTTPLLPWSQQISAVIINPNLDRSFPQIILNIDDQVLDLSQKYLDMATCPALTIPIPILPIPDIPIGTDKPLGSLINNVHWSQTAIDNDKAVLSIAADISHTCKKSMKETVHSQDFRLQLDFRIQKNAIGKWELTPDSVLMQQRKDAWWKIISFNFPERP